MRPPSWSKHVNIFISRGSYRRQSSRRLNSLSVGCEHSWLTSSLVSIPWPHPLNASLHAGGIILGLGGSQDVSKSSRIATCTPLPSSPPADDCWISESNPLPYNISITPQRGPWDGGGGVAFQGDTICKHVLVLILNLPSNKSDSHDWLLWRGGGSEMSSIWWYVVSLGSGTNNNWGRRTKTDLWVSPWSASEKMGPVWLTEICPHHRFNPVLQTGKLDWKSQKFSTPSKMFVV